MKKKLKVTEQQIQKLCIEYLQRKNFYVQRLNSGTFKMGDYYVRGAAEGTPDLLALKIGYPAIFFEVKRPGKHPTPVQMAKMEELEAHGAVCMVVHDLDELQEALLAI